MSRPLSQKTRFGWITGVCLASCLGLLSCSKGGPGPGPGPYLGKIEGATILGPGGKSRLSVTGAGTGPISWSLVPSGMGHFEVEKALPAFQGTTPPPSYVSEGTFFSGPSVGTGDLMATAGYGSTSFKSLVNLKIVRGIAITASSTQVTLTPRYQKEIAVSVLHPEHPTSSIPQGVTWAPEGDFSDGHILTGPPGKLLFDAPSIPGSYVIKGIADADPTASVLIRVTVQ